MRTKARSVVSSGTGRRQVSGKEKPRSSTEDKADGGDLNKIIGSTVAGGSRLPGGPRADEVSARPSSCVLGDPDPDSSLATSRQPCSKTIDALEVSKMPLSQDTAPPCVS